MDSSGSAGDAKSKLLASEDELTRLTIKDPSAKHLSPKEDASQRRLCALANDVTEASMRDCWRGGAFFVHPVLPAEKEEPKSVRNLAMLPRSSEKAEDVLRRHSTAVLNCK